MPSENLKAALQVIETTEVTEAMFNNRVNF